jgi:hypothetical protein
MTTCEARKRTLAHSHTRVRANRAFVQLSQSADALQRGGDTTSCGLRVVHSSVAEKGVIKQ